MAGVCCPDSEESSEKERWGTAEYLALKMTEDDPLSFSFSNLDNFCHQDKIVRDIVAAVDMGKFAIESDTTEILDNSADSTLEIVAPKNSEICDKGDNPVDSTADDAEEFAQSSGMTWGFELVTKKLFQSENYVSKKKQRQKGKRKSAEQNTQGKGKWKLISLEDVGIYPTLFPRPQAKVSEKIAKLSPEKVNDEVEYEFDELEKKVSNANDLKLYDAFQVTEIRADRDRKIIKAHKQVKDKYCWNVKNNNGKNLYVHHRAYKLMELKPQKNYYLPQGKKEKTSVPVNEVKLKGKRSSAQYGNDDDVNRPKPPVASQTRHALHSQNAPTALAGDDTLVNLLISLQHRDLSPEDYDLLLRLDEQVAPKTLPKDILASFKTDQAVDSDCSLQCAICMENYSVGQMRKFLPCDHVFHANCINMWLENSSMNCPLDGLPVR